MFARITTYQADPARLDEMTARLDGLKPKVKALSGLVSAYTTWRSDGQGVTVAIYESQSAAEAASAQIQGIWGGLMDFLTGPPQTETYDNVEDLLA
jgi:hypothetical protein